MFLIQQALRSCGAALYAAATLVLFTLAPVRTNAQIPSTDTLTLDLKQAEKRFLEKNLELLAQHYNIEAGKALAQQARLWDDPTLTTDQNLYSNNKWFEHGTNPDGSPRGQYFIQLQQLIKTGGKISKQVGMANTNTAISEWQFNELMQALKYKLRTDLYTMSQLLAVQQLYGEQQQQLRQLLTGMNDQFKAGNIARKDLLRIQALQVNLEQEIATNLNDIEDQQSELKTLLYITGNTFVRPAIDPGITWKNNLPDLSTLIDSARLNNASYRIDQLQVQYQQQNLGFQKALAIPDVTVGPSYDLNSNYTPRYFGLGISLPIPVLNGNKGNIKAAKWQVKQQEAHFSQADVSLQNDVTGAYRKYSTTLQLHNATQDGFFSDYKNLQSHVAESFKERQISMLEFIDYFHDYETVRTQQLQQILNLQIAREELNRQVGINLFD